MARKAGLLVPIFAVATIIVVNSPVSVLAQEPAQRIAISDEVLTTEFSAAQSCTGSHCRTKTQRRATGAHKTTKSHTAAGVHKPGKIGTGPSKLGTGPAMLGSGPGILGLQSGSANAEKDTGVPAALSNKARAYFDKGMNPPADNNPADPPPGMTPFAGLPPPGEFPGYKKGERLPPLPPGWTIETIEFEPGVVRLIPTPPKGWRPKGDTGPAATQADLDRLHAKIAECKQAFWKEATEYSKILDGLYAQKNELRKNHEDMSDIDAQIKDTRSMFQMKHKEADECWDKYFKIWVASGYKSP
jgi:hypothetical protein